MPGTPGRQSDGDPEAAGDSAHVKLGGHCSLPSQVGTQMSFSADTSKKPARQPWPGGHGLPPAPHMLTTHCRWSTEIGNDVRCWSRVDAQTCDVSPHSVSCEQTGIWTHTPSSSTTSVR